MKIRTLIGVLIIGALCGTYAARGQDIDSMAPVVVKTVPEAGSKDVAPGEVEIKVTFSKLMSDNSWSWSTAHPKHKLPSLRGLAVDESGTVFAAGTACHSVVKITPSGAVETILRVERPWSPTGVAVHRGEVCVLEYTNANGGHDEPWLPRVREVGAKGKVTTLVTIDSKASTTERK